jgi:hypothetical protein
MQGAIGGKHGTMRQSPENTRDMDVTFGEKVNFE